MPVGKVKAFDESRGFGTFVLEDGAELPFDISVCNTRFVAVGAVAEVKTEGGRDGRLRTKLAVFQLASQRRAPLAEVVTWLQKHGLLLDWSEAEVQRRGTDFGRELGKDEVGSLFREYYGHGPSERSIRERAVVLNWRLYEATPDALFEVFSRLAELKDLKPLRTYEGTVVPPAEGEDAAAIDITGTVEPLAVWFNEELTRRGRAERFYSVTTGFDFEVFILRSTATLVPEEAPVPFLFVVE